MTTMITEIYEALKEAGASGKRQKARPRRSPLMKSALVTSNADLAY